MISTVDILAAKNQLAARVPGGSFDGILLTLGQYQALVPVKEQAKLHPSHVVGPWFEWLGIPVWVVPAQDFYTKYRVLLDEGKRILGLP